MALTVFTIGYKIQCNKLLYFESTLIIVITNTTELREENKHEQDAQKISFNFFDQFKDT